MKYICLALIMFYQRFISPHKGFNCAHHQVHHRDTCSNAVKNIIKQHSLRASLPLVQARFNACKQAAETLAAQRQPLNHYADLPIPCDCAVDLPIPGVEGGCTETNSCDLCWDWPNMKRRTRRILVFIFLIISLIAVYFYGAQITKIELSNIDAGQRSDSLLQKLISRDKPLLRTLIVIHGRKIYSETKSTEGLSDGETLLLEFDQAFSPSDISTLEIHDARFSAAADLLVLGQVLDQFDNPKLTGQGKRFSYGFRSRWGF